MAGWRCGYTGDALGWPERSRGHFESSLAKQISSPVEDQDCPSWKSEGWIQESKYDMNLVLFDALLRHLLWTGDVEYAKQVWPNLKRHLAWEKNENPLWCAYVTETPHTGLEAEHIWKLYMTLTQVEAAFRNLKTELGTRPIFHQSAERTEAHLFISLLAYSVLACIEHRLRQAGDHRQWRTVREQIIR